MELKLPSISGVIPWSLAVRTLALAASWFWTPWWIFAALTAIFFYQGTRDPDLSYNRTLAAYLITTFGVGLGGGATAGAAAVIVLAEAVILIGLRHLLWLKKVLLFRLLSALIWVTFLAAFFWLTSLAGYVWYGFAAMAAVAYLLSRDLVRVAIGREQEKFWAGIMTLVLFQTAWAVFMLPVEPINKAAIILLVFLVMQEYLIQSETGRKATPVFYLTLVSVLATLFLIILFISSWTG